MDEEFKEVDAPQPPAVTAENALSRKTKRRIGVARQLVNQAMTLNEKRLCTGRAKLRDENGEILRDEAGAARTRPCKNRPITGGTVCSYHGGKAPQVKRKAEKRLLAMVEPAMAELEVLYTQNDHLPTKLGAIRTVLERAGTKNPIGALSKDTGETDTRPIIQIGNINLGGLDMVKAGLIPAPKLNTALLSGMRATDAEVVDEEDGGGE